MSIKSNEIAIETDEMDLFYDVQDYQTKTLKEYFLQKLSGKFEKKTKHAVRGINLKVRKGECVGIIGHNGSGKSTLLKVIAGIIEPSRGKLSTNGSIVPMIELGAGFDPELTGRENIRLCCSILGLTRVEIEGLSPIIEEFSELKSELDSPIKTYSSGMYMRLGFACSVVMHAEIILIDEILAVGDLNFQKKCIARLHELKSSGSTILIVSHDMSTLKMICERLIVIDEGAKVYDGLIDPGSDFYNDLMEEKRLSNLSPEERLEEERKTILKENDDQAVFGSRVELARVEIDNKFQEYKSGEPIKLKIKVNIKENLEKPSCIGFALHSSSTKARIIGLNTNSLVDSLRSKDLKDKGVHEIEFELNDMELATGDYSIIAAAHNFDLTETFDFKADCVNFKVVDDLDSDNFDRDLLPSRKIIQSCSINTQAPM